MARHPIQPLETDAHGVLRFKANAIVRFLLDEGPFDMNHIALRDFPREDLEQFAQLIGYSLSGSPSYVSDETYATASTMHENGLSEVEARVAVLEDRLRTVREGLRAVVPAVFRIHPDDLVAE